MWPERGSNHNNLALWHVIELASVICYKQHMHLLSQVVVLLAYTRASTTSPYLSHVMRLWYFSSSVAHLSNTHAQPSSGVRCLIFHSSCVRTAKALTRLSGCAGSPEPSLVAYVISTIISWTGPFDVKCSRFSFTFGIEWAKIITQLC